jgi:hypothetical protein
MITYHGRFSASSTAHYRALAGQARKEAAAAKTPEVQQALEDVAKGYERLAIRAEKLPRAS